MIFLLKASLFTFPVNFAACGLLVEGLSCSAAKTLSAPQDPQKGPVLALLSRIYFLPHKEHLGIESGHPKLSFFNILLPNNKTLVSAGFHLIQKPVFFERKLDILAIIN